MRIEIIILCICVCLFILIIGFVVGMLIENKISKNYFLEIIKIFDESLTEQNKRYDEYYQKNNKLNTDYLDKIVDLVMESHILLSEALDRIIKIKEN